MCNVAASTTAQQAEALMVAWFVYPQANMHLQLMDFVAQQCVMMCKVGLT